MHNLSFWKAGAVPAAAEEANQGIDFPGLYDLLVTVMTLGRERSFRREILNLAAIGPGRHMLDIGCGTGTLAVAAAKRARPGGSVAGVDISDNMLAAARLKAQRAGCDIPFQRADAAELPFAAESFDIVTTTLALHMVPRGRRPLYLAEATRVLKPGGRLLLVDYAGEPGQRSHLSARHGRHGAFDLNNLREPLSALGYGEIESGPVGWLSLHFLRGRKAPTGAGG